MTEDTSEFRVTITGPETAREQLYNKLQNYVGEGQRSGVEIRVERVRVEELKEGGGFSNNHD